MNINFVILKNEVRLDKMIREKAPAEKIHNQQLRINRLKKKRELVQ